MSNIPDPSLLIQYYELITYVRSHTKSHYSLLL